MAFKELLKLTDQGVDASIIKFNNVTLQSHKYVCVREEAKRSVTVIETATRKTNRLPPLTVDSAIMNPVSYTIALRAKQNLQIFNLDMKVKMKSTTLTDNVVFWKWIDPKTIAIVTDTSVYHWSMDGEAQPEKVFDRSPYEGAVQIINYRATPDKKWLMLGGIAASATAASKTVGVLQVYSVEAKASQPVMDSHAACFARITLDGRTKPSDLFCFTKPTDTGMRLMVLEVGIPKSEQKTAFKHQAQLSIEASDFPVAMLPDNKYGSVFIITKQGFLLLYELQSGKRIFGEKISHHTMFASVENTDDGGIVTVDQSGRVAELSIDPAKVVKYITAVLKDLEFGVQMARRYKLGGAEDFLHEQFQALLQSGRSEEAMNLAATSPSLRTIETINAFRTGASGLLSQYFQLLLKEGKLNVVESVELTKAFLSRGGASKMDHITGWIKEQKLEPSEELGDLLRNHNTNVALSVYLRAKVPEKVIACFLSLGAQEVDEEKAMKCFKNITTYSRQAEFTPDYPKLVQQLMMINRDRAKDFALSLILDEGGPKLDVGATVDAFMSQGDIKNTTNILLEYLKPRGDQEQDGPLQTKLLEINLLHKPQVADAIMDSEEYKFTHYDKLKIAQLCERAQLYQRALEHYTDLSDIKRVLSNTHMLNPEFLLEYFGRMTPENCLECLRDLLKFNIQQNIRLVVEVAKKWNEWLTPAALIKLFEEFKSFHGLYFYLGSFVNYSQDKTVVFKYIQAAIKLGQLKEAERVCRDNEYYDPKEIKEMLLASDLKDPRPLIHVCDRHDFVDELTQYLYSNNLQNFIEAYVQRMNPKAAPKVVGTLLELNASEEQIRKLITSVRPPPDMPDFTKQLVEEVEKRSRLKILRTWLEERVSEGSQDPEVHNGLGKIYVDVSYSPQVFLTTNKYYDSRVVGKYCEARDPHLAFIAYKRAGGDCDDELVDVCSKNGFWKDEAKYLVERQSLPLWAKVLSEDNKDRRALIDQVVATALPESRVAEEVSTTVKAFMAANLPKELIELLERIILHGPPDGEFQSNRNLQNLLILTAIKADKKRVMDYIKRLDKYDGPDIAKIAITDQYQLYEEAHFIYNKFKKGPEAIQVLLDNIGSIERAVEYAEYLDQPECWSLLAKAQLENGQVKQAIESFIKAEDATLAEAVIKAAKQDKLFVELISFLKMARAKLKETTLDNELLYAYARADKLTDLEEFIQGSHSAKIGDVGEILFQEGLYQAAKILFSFINNHAKLAICLVKLEQFQEAVDAARKANAIPTWKAVCFACVDAQKFRLASMCGMNVIGFMDHLTDLIRHYEIQGYFEEVISLLEQGVLNERAHQGIYTQLGILYAKYKEEKLMDHVKMSWSRLNIPILLRECQKNLHWPEVVFLYSHYDQYDNAVNTLIAHSTECWKHDLFKEVLKKVSNTTIYYKAIDFYLEEHPLQLTDLLLDMSSNLDHSRVVQIVRRAGHLSLIKKYLLHVQRENIVAVNEAVNELAVEEEDYKGLRQSIDNHNNFDQTTLATSLEHHPLLEFRRISAYLNKMNKKWKPSIELSKRDQLWKDAMETTAESKDQELAENLLRFFVEEGRKECFAACLFTCYELIRPDVVLELAWRHDLMNFAMPYLIQSLREYDVKMGQIYAKFAAQDKEKEDKEKQDKEQAQSGVDVSVGHSFVAPLAIGPPPGMMPMPPSYGGYPGSGFFS